MSDAVEIYVCFEGQALKDGKVEYSQSIGDKYSAERDAKDRVKRNPLIHKIAYYKINDEGDFRIFYSFTNKDLHNPQTVIQEHSTKPKLKKPPKRTFLEKLFGVGSGQKTTLKRKTLKK
ncbi:hypothetical protein [Magnetovibrio blakemorei]|uniref:Uncharacterized protein n=1 Tax=Magnetovibrio blakemorei TaxID=28181 RepID=A0A1E5Q8I4_9PROT|nr:hypothetical protein [Magnetovibrio blakemorei]OEJ67707.1 hypothetical protein BEN30_08210 [Magnetovibrio blakemorei]